MKDRFIIGFVSGVIAGILPNIFNWSAYHLHLSTLRWADFMGALVYGKKPVTIVETYFATVYVYFFLGLLGILFSYLIPKITSKNYLFKGVIFSLFIWFLAHTITVLFKVPELTNLPLKTALSNSVSAILWGLSLGYTLSWFDNRVKTKKGP